MRHLRIAEQTLRLTVDRSQPQYVCRSCLTHTARQYHTSGVRSAELPFLKRISKAIFGDKSKTESGEGEKVQTKTEEEVKSGTETAPADGLQKQKYNGVVYEFAARVDPAQNKAYVPSHTWDGLEKIGGKAWAKKHNDKGEQYTGFIPNETHSLSADGWRRLLHHIVVEIAILHSQNRKFADICQVPPGNSRPDVTVRGRVTQHVTVRGRVTQNLTVKFADESFEEAVRLSLQTSRTTSSKFNFKSLEKLPQGYTPPKWCNLRLEDPSLKLAILKRTMQLTGKRIPDIKAANAKTLEDLYNAVKVKEKPKKLAQMPEVQEIAQTIPNVKVYPSRRTPVHKEKVIGRWKVIEQELLRRDLPVFGSRWVNAKEGLRAHER